MLEKMDESDAEYGTVMAHFLKDLQQAGIMTSIDVVSDTRGLFAEKVIPALRYTDNAIMNELESCGVSGLAPRDENGKINKENIKKTMEIIKPDFVLNDIKEGELSMSKIWTDMHVAMLQDKENLSFEEAEKQAEIRYPLPYELDFRMHELKKEK